MTLIFIFMSLRSQAAEKTSFEDALEAQSSTSTQERWVEYGGTLYREVEYNGKKYLLKFSSRQGEFTELDCKVPSQQNPNMLEVGTSFFHRTKLFVSFLQEKCAPDAHGQIRNSVTIDPRIGIIFPDRPGDVIKKKSLYWNPLLGPLGLGFGGEW